MNIKMNEITRSEFILLANRMLCRAVEEMACDLGKYYYSEEQISEPAHTAAIVTKFPSLMNERWNGAKFGGCFIHQSPYIKMNKVKGKNGCEVGDLLCVCKKTINGKKHLNAILFQLKKDRSKNRRVKPDNSIQLRLYSDWPEFSFVQNILISGDNHFDIHPKTVSQGAQYMFINRYPYFDCRCYSFGCCYSFPVVFTHSIPAPIMKNDPEFSFGSFLWSFIHWQNGRPISESVATAKDDWSRLIWELIERSKKNVFTINKGKDNEILAQRYQGDTIGYMTKMVAELYAGMTSQEWFSHVQCLWDDAPKSEGNIHVESAKNTNREGGDGISILLIDLDVENVGMRID